MLTATLAFFSGSYALYTIFDNLPVALAFGGVWSLIIFNLDRLIVSSMRKIGRWFKQLLAATPRLFLAFLIAIVISKPIEIRLLETKINKILFETSKTKVEGLTEECQSVREDYDNRIKAKRVEIEQKESSKPPLMAGFENELEVKKQERKAQLKEIEKHTQRYYARVKEARTEIQGLDQSSSSYYYTKKELESEIKDAEKRIQKYEDKLKPIDREIDNINTSIEEQFNTYLVDLSTLRNSNNLAILDLERERNDELKNCQENKKIGEGIYSTNSLPDLIVALQQATDDDLIMSRISLFIMLLFIMLETAPVFVKLLSPRGPYDEILYDMEHKFRTEAEDTIIRREQELKKKIEMYASIDKTEMEQEIHNNRKILQTISDAHHDLIKEQVEIWLDEEKSKIRSNGHDKT